MASIQELPPLAQLVPVETLDRLRRVFKAAVGVPLVFTDAQGVPLTDVEEPLRFCATLVRAPGTLCLRRAKWDEPEREVEEQILAQHQGTEPLAHRCMGGFRDAAVPIVVEGHTVGYAVFARSLVEEPDVAGFRQMASGAGMAPEVGEAVARAALVMPQQRVADVAEFLQIITGLVAKAAYDTLRANQVLALEKLRDDLVHMIVHDLRTPLTAIMGTLQTILDTQCDEAITREFVPMALTSANTLLEMVNTLLDISKMESGEMELDLQEVDFAELVTAAVQQVRPLARERHQELTTALPANCLRGPADPEKLQRLLVNLLGNAIKFTQDGGRIHAAVECDTQGVTFSVTDNGPGIPVEYHQKIFEKFGQVEARSGAHEHSTGLGLTFCKMVAEAHGGRIWLESEVGRGSKFSVWIPLRRTPEAAETPA